jgi:hypothetical protein
MVACLCVTTLDEPTTVTTDFQATDTIVSVASSEYETKRII